MNQNYGRLKRPRGDNTFSKAKKSKNSISVSVPIKRYVNRALSRHIEKKRYIVSGNAINTIKTSQGTVGGTTYLPLLPRLNQGNRAYERVGNYVTVTSGSIEGWIALRPYSATLNTFQPCIVKMWLCSQKVANSATLDATSFTNFFDIASTSQAMVGASPDLVLPINKQDWVLWDSKIVYLGDSTPTTTFSPTATAATDGSAMYTAPFKFKYPKSCLKKLAYDDTTTDCTNKNLFLIFQAVAADGSTQVGPIANLVTYLIHSEYTDA